jgi:hypothetical protein
MIWPSRASWRRIPRTSRASSFSTGLSAASAGAAGVLAGGTCSSLFMLRLQYSKVARQSGSGRCDRPRPRSYDATGVERSGAGGPEPSEGHSRTLAHVAKVLRQGASGVLAGLLGASSASSSASSRRGANRTWVGVPQRPDPHSRRRNSEPFALTVGLIATAQVGSVSRALCPAERRPHPGAGRERTVTRAHQPHAGNANRTASRDGRDHGKLRNKTAAKY